VSAKKKRVKALMPRPGFVACVVMGLLLFPIGLAAQGAPATETLPDFVQSEMQSVQELLAHAMAEFEGPSQSRSIVLFDGIIEKLEGLKRQDLLPVHGREILAQVYDLQGRAYFNIGLQEKAAQVFRQLIQMQPQYSLKKEQVSPKIVEFFNTVKKALVGYLAVSSTPPGARVTLNGDFLSITDFFPIEVLAGEYTVEISREGYKNETRTVSIAPRAVETIEVDLVRIAASGFFVTQPPGVEIWIDGALRATTGGTLHPTLHEQFIERGFDVNRTSARTEVANISLGTHGVEFRKRCFELIKTSIDVPEPKDYDIEPVRLEESLAALRLTSEPPGARVYLDGESRGVTPIYLEGLCSGDHHLEVKHAAGKFIQEIALARNEVLTLDCPIRPSLAFVGIVVKSPAAERFRSEAEQRLVRWLSNVHSLNVVRSPRERVDEVLKMGGMTVEDLLPDSGVDPERVRKVTERLAAMLEVQGFLIAALEEQQILRSIFLNLLAAGSSVADTRQVSLADTSASESIISALDYTARWSRTWTGLITVDTLRESGLPILRVVPGSPAARAGIRPGEKVISVGGKSPTTSVELLKLIAEQSPQTRLSLGIEYGDANRLVELTLETTPVEVPLNDPKLLYNRLMLDLRQDMDGQPGTESAAYALLNLGLCAMHFGDLAAAHDLFLRATTALPERPGLGRGTAFYYLGMALERLDYAKEAAGAYDSAARIDGATIFDNDGPLVKDVIPQKAEM
jgi:tetratricopeptide (TPR) repeat protein